MKKAIPLLFLMTPAFAAEQDCSAVETRANALISAVRSQRERSSDAEAAAAVEISRLRDEIERLKADQKKDALK